MLPKVPLLLALSTGLAWGQAKPVVLKAARLWDGKGDAALKEGMVILQNGRITAVGSGLPVPSGAEVMDLGNATLLPGLIDAHTHLLLQDLEAKDLNRQDELIFRPIYAQGTPLRTLVGAANAKAMLEAGFTTVRDLGNSGLNGDLALRDGIRMGLVPGPRIVASSRALAPLGGQFSRLTREARTLEGQEYAEVASPEEALKATREAFADGADCIKVIVDARLSLGLAELKAIVGEAHRMHRKVAAHAVSDAAVDAALEAGVDSLEHGYHLKEAQAKVMAQRHIFLVPTDFSSQTLEPFSPTPEDRADVQKALEGNRRRLLTAKRLGVPIALGSDAYFTWGGRSRGESAKDVFRAFVESGLTPVETLRAATRDAAELLGLAGEVGTLAPGAVADVMAVEGDPLVDVAALSQVRLVLQGGRVVARRLPAP
ncbi:MAG TPA: amidohydrolase family protein [Holophagaceae bacterium]|nr:amidohydrolase family protein [Holophagaceae bacterium]